MTAAAGAVSPSSRRRVLITGAGSGIGRAVALDLSARGMDVVLTDLVAAQPTIEAIGGSGSFFEMDVTSSSQVREVLRRAHAESPLDHIVHCAGILAGRPGDAAFKPIIEQEDADWRRVMEVNLNGAFNVLREGAKALIAAERGGSMVAVTSGASARPIPDWGPYCVSKAGAAMLVKALAVELAPHGIRINSVAPGMIDTPMTSAFFESPMIPRPPLGRHGMVGDIVGPVRFLLSDEAAFITGKTLFVDGGVFSG